MEAAESLLHDLQPDASYPHDFVVYRITSYRADTSAESRELLVGRALIADVVTFIQRISERLELTVETTARDAIRPEDLAAELNVSTRSLLRWRRRGLVFHYVMRPNETAAGRESRGHRRHLVCFRDAFESFREREPELVNGASTFSRADHAEQQKLADAVAQLRADESIGLTDAVRRVAQTSNRSIATVRGAVRAIEQSVPDAAPEGMTPASGPRSQRAAARTSGIAMLRGFERGLGATRLGRRCGRSAASIRRRLRTARLERMAGPRGKWQESWADVELRAWYAGRTEMHHFAILNAKAARTLIREPWPMDAAAWIVNTSSTTSATGERRDSVPGIDSPDVEAARTRIAAFRVLMARAADRLSNVRGSPAEPTLDRLETDLRWAYMLARTLVRTHIRVLLRPLEAVLGRTLSELDQTAAAPLLIAACAVGAEEILSFDPGRMPDLSRRLDWAMDRALAAEGGIERFARAGETLRSLPTRHSELDRALFGCMPWARGIMASSRDVAWLLESAAGDEFSPLASADGLTAMLPPQTAESIAVRHGLRVTSVSRRLRRLRLQRRSEVSRSRTLASHAGSGTS